MFSVDVRELAVETVGPHRRVGALQAGHAM